MSTWSQTDSSVRSRLTQRWRRWLDRRLPPARTIELQQRRLFIFATAAGFGFLFSLLLMLLAAINYQNNMAYGLTFWLAMTANVAILHTNANLLGLTVSGVSASSVFPGQLTKLTLTLSTGPKRSYRAVHVSLDDSEQVVDIDRGQSVEVVLYAKVDGRGWFDPGRIKIETRYPLGLWRCWSFLRLDLQALVYPQPLAGPDAAHCGDDGYTGEGKGGDQEDLYGFREYSPGDPLKQIHWRGFARGQTLQTLTYAAPEQSDVWLDWEAYEGFPTESRLSFLCERALLHEREGRDYGLKLPEQTIDPGCGDRHQQRVLRALALYQKGAVD